MMVSAWEGGFDGAAIPHMTPSEVKGMFACKTAQARQNQADYDILAWLVGSYTGHGVNSPKTYPDTPRNASRILGEESRDGAEMTAEEMKSVLLGIAQRSGYHGT